MNFIEVYYSPAQVSNPDSASPSPRKPAWVVADWMTQNVPVKIVKPIPESLDQLVLAHTRKYIDGILN